jgi:hypothetical protein
MIRRDALQRGLVNLELFRIALDRPAARLLGWRFYALAYLLGPGAILYQLVTRLRRRMASQEERRRQEERQRRLAPFRLALRRLEGCPGRVRLEGFPGFWDGPLLDPQRLRVVASTALPTYKMLLAALLTTLYMGLVLPLSHRLGLPSFGEETIVAFSLALLGGLLYVLFADPWLALLGPLLFLLARSFLVFSHGILGFYLGLVGVVILMYVVEFFFVPRPLPPTLFLYVNEPGHPLQTYREGEQPPWLQGRAYWVWRFVILAPAEITKFWERDWERVEVWVRAEGERAGEIEWILSDFHYRELWYRPERWVGARRWPTQRRRLEAWRREPWRRHHWLLEVDMDLLFHTPWIRGISLEPGPSPRPRTVIRRMLKSLGKRYPRDFPPRYWHRIHELELEGIELFRDVPEHFRKASEWSVLARPWSYWRYPLGVLTPVTRYLYNPADASTRDVPSACAFQIKEPGPGAEARRRPRESSPGT